MKKIGVEKEFLVINKFGEVINQADKIINCEKNPGFIVRESSVGTVEVNSDPEISLGALETSLKAQLNTLDEIAHQKGLLVVPMSEVGPDNALMARQGLERYKLNKLFFGQKKGHLYQSLCGTHLHIDKEDNVAMQYNLLQSLDPIFLMLSSSPFIQGSYSSVAGRVFAQRCRVFSDKPNHGGLLGYVDHVSEIDHLSRLQYAMLIQDLRTKGIPAELSRSVYVPDSSAWGPLRLRTHTLEMRGCDSNILSLVLAFTATVKGINDYVFDQGLEVVVSQDDCYAVTESQIQLPSYAFLKVMEQEAMHYGLKSEKVQSYLSYLVDIAHMGLPQEDRHYLKPFELMLQNHTTMADMVFRLASRLSDKYDQKICSQAAKTINLFMNEAYRVDREDKSNFLDMITYGIDSMFEKMNVSLAC